MSKNIYDYFPLIPMNENIIMLYRLCLKQLGKLKQKDPKIHSIVSLSLQQKKNKITLKQSMDILSGLNKLLSKANEGDEKSIMKTVRIFTNNSQYVNSKLNFCAGYDTKAMQRLQQDIEFQELTEKDQQFVSKIIRKICDKKPTYKYKTVGKYLESTGPENMEARMMNQNNQAIDQEELEQMSLCSEWKWAYRNLKIKKEGGLNQFIEELAERKIFIL